MVDSEIVYFLKFTILSAWGFGQLSNYPLIYHVENSDFSLNVMKLQSFQSFTLATSEQSISVSLPHFVN